MAKGMVNNTVDNITDSMKNIYQSVLADKKFLVMVIFITVVLLLTTYYVYTRFVKPALNLDHVLNKEFKTTGSKDNNDVVVIFFFTSWCPHCKNAKPEWNKFKDYVNNMNQSNDYTITLSEVDCDKKPELAEKYNVEGYPTIKLLYKGDVYNYDAKPNKAHLIKFLETSIE